MKIKRSLSCAAALALAACGTGGETNERPLTTDEKALVTGAGSFGFDLLREAEARAGGENVFVSPLSVSMALGMLYNGTRGDTATELADALGFAGMTETQINAGYRGLIDYFTALDSRVTVNIANSIWYDQTFAVEPAFIETNRKSFDAEVAQLDFRSASAVTTINQWVSDKTNGLIRTIIDGIDEAARMFLIDAVYFKGTWTTEFDPDHTYDGTFTPENGPQESARMMFVEASFAHGSNDVFQTLQLPYGAGLYKMSILLPHTGKSTSDVLTELSSDRWAEVTAGLKAKEISVHLPRFQLEFETSLVQHLQALGIQKVFGGGDLSGINAEEQLEVGDVKHKTFVRVDEEGTEAAAVTSVEVRTTSLGPELRADRPFLVLIHDDASGAILFAGVIKSPKAIP